jgi:hypothetical protein
MKNRKVLLFVIVMGVLAGILLLNGKKSATPDAFENESQESAQQRPAETQALSPARESPKPLETPSPGRSEEAVTPAAESADAGPEESVSEPSEDVASRIKKNLAGARKLLQQKAAIEKMKSEEVHDTPKVTLDAARRLGEIAELEAAHPEQAESFRDFYLECARDESTMTVTRAQCLDKYIKAAKLDAAAQKQFLAEFPEEIVRLVEALQ